MLAQINCITTKHNIYNQIVYYDINNNVYLIQPELITYSPIATMESSSINYEGEKAWKTIINKREFLTFRTLGQLIIDDHKNLQSVRSRLTVMLKLDNKTYIVSPSRHSKNFETELKKFDVKSQ